MKIIEYTVKKVILTPEEKSIKRSWGKDWNIIMKLHNKKQPIYLVIGTWSGYNSHQRRIVHVELINAPMYLKQSNIHNNKISGYAGTIEHSDNTKLEVTIKEYTLEKLLSENVKRKSSYTDLIQKLTESSDNYYKVA